MKLQLDNMYHTFRAVEESTGTVLDGLENMARTLPTLQRRLGVDPDQYIKYYFVCDSCWTRHDPADLYILRSSRCDKEDCGGCVYTIKPTKKHRLRRVPTKILPTTPLIPALRRILGRRGKVDELNHWRAGSAPDQPARVPPSQAKGYDAFPDHNIPLGDISDGWGWRAAQAGLVRRQTNNNRWGFEDFDAEERHQRFVSLPLGIMLMLNIDWYAVRRTHLESTLIFSPRFTSNKGGKHSAGAVYITLLNNPLATRFRREETILACVIPGPTEPSLEQLNQILEPIVEDLKTLEYGIFFKAHDSDHNDLAHARLYLNCSDLPATRKVSGMRGVTSKIFMCILCYASLIMLACVDCFDPTSKSSILLYINQSYIHPHRVQPSRRSQVPQVCL